MTAPFRTVSLFAAALLLAACGSPEAAEEAAATAAEESAERDRALVENAVRDAYEAEGAEVTDVTMELAPDGARYIGNATIRDPESGNEITVECRYTTDAGGTPRLNCDRMTDAG
ncbi:hypothetical protein [Parasphingopyxis sp.]|uniref:hypothetical protein n=1 Tax=Parasphingopyxis sp. TaxID=1920299 RepID=UPI00261E66AF|nr:hypothetical protein [Parasphingopyxis sp.]